MGINYSVAGYFPEKSRWCSIEHIGQGGSTAYIALNNPEEWTLRNIITHLSFFNMLRCSFIAGGRSRQDMLLEALLLLLVLLILMQLIVLSTMMIIMLTVIRQSALDGQGPYSYTQDTSGFTNNLFLCC